MPKIRRRDPLEGLQGEAREAKLAEMRREGILKILFLLSSAVAAFFWPSLQDLVVWGLSAASGAVTAYSDSVVVLSVLSAVHLGAILLKRTFPAKPELGKLSARILITSALASVVLAALVEYAGEGASLRLSSACLIVYLPLLYIAT